jgi:hypothetical protein
MGIVYGEFLAPSKEIRVTNLNTAGAGLIYAGASTLPSAMLGITALTAEDEPMARTPDAGPAPVVSVRDGRAKTQVVMTNHSNAMVPSMLVLLKP